MGLLSPTEGVISVDGVLLDKNTVLAWQKIIAHVPQSIYLSDSTIAENIAFGVPSKEINQIWVEKSAKDAELHDFISQLPKGYDTRVGERGVRLSGGQRQRIGIARALYKKAEIIILDEATSALDVATEVAIIENVKCLDGKLTIFFVAHRLTTLKDCDFIIELNSGRVIRTGLYEEIVTK
jgi:ATP-binding cassette subfamily B protein